MRLYMQIRHLKIHNFRGIKEIEWIPRTNLLCLLGPNDSTKTTILDAIEYCLWPRYNIFVYDTDFYNSDISSPIIIEVTLGDLPEQIIQDDGYGLCLRGWCADSTINDEPSDEDEKVITVRFQVTGDFEPSWSVINDRLPEGKKFSSKARESIGVSRLGSYLDRHLRWCRGSALTSMTEKYESIIGLLNTASKAIKDSIKLQDIPEQLKQAADEAQNIAKKYGISPIGKYLPRLDTQAVSIGEGGFSLHDGLVPLNRFGAGTRRLLILGLQLNLMNRGSIILIDEIEYGLAPYKIRHILNLLKHEINSAVNKLGQLFLTTHAPITIVELECENLYIVGNVAGITSIKQIDSYLQPYIRKLPESFFSKKVIVCEGKTEVGLLRAFDNWWDNVMGLCSFALAGVVPAPGRGHEAPKIAKMFNELGYDVALLVDSDESLSIGDAVLTDMGILVLKWDNECSIEERICLDLPWAGVIRLVELAIDIKSCEHVISVINNNLNNGDTITDNKSEWEDTECLRKAIAKAAKKTSWFKNTSYGKEVGNIVIENIESMGNTDTILKLKKLRNWIDDSK